MASTPPPVIGKVGNLTVFITPPATPSPADTPRSLLPESPRSDFATANATPRAAASPASPPHEQPATPPPVKPASPPPAQMVTPPVKTVSPPLLAVKLSTPTPPPVQVLPPEFEKAGARPDGSVFAFFWDAVARVQEAHASLDEYISNWFGLDQSKYPWALNDYYENNGKFAKYISAHTALKYGNSGPRTSSPSSLGRYGSFSCHKDLPMIGTFDRDILELQA